MATLGRSLKSPVYLSRASSSSNGSRRPALAARTFSHSSDISAASANSWADDHLDVGVMSGLNTPALEKTVTESLAAKESRPAQKEVKGRHSQGKSDIFLASLSLCVCALQAKPPLHTSAASPFDLNLNAIESSSLQSARSARSNHSNPITIELPAVRKFKSGPSRTPPEPLSARGDVPGGYFPLHEDATARIHRPHPFAGARKPRQQRIDPAIEPLVLPAAGGTSNLPAMTEPTTLLAAKSNEPRSNLPVASYLPSGVRDTTLPMGKYYPSNYEKRNHPPHPTTSMEPTPVQPRPVGVAGLSSSVKSESQVPTVSNENFQTSRQDSDVRRKLAQYQRDMIAQARLAATEILGSSAKTTTAPQPTTATATVMLNGFPLAGMRHFAASGGGKPLSPRLLPLGSPGPVTPMDLEGGELGSVDRGCGSSTFGDIMGRSGASSPAVEAGAGRFF
ncbi:Transcriptional regulator CRZ1 [Verticillium dahliae VDG2]|nr:Transcriptional regulator CRZ1 [Verticillium dahliae VDG2]